MKLSTVQTHRFRDRLEVDSIFKEVDGWDAKASHSYQNLSGSEPLNDRADTMQESPIMSGTSDRELSLAATNQAEDPQDGGKLRETVNSLSRSAKRPIHTRERSSMLQAGE